MSFFETLEAYSFERSSLRVSHARFHFSFAIRILDPTRQRYRSVVGEHVAIEWVQSGVVDIGDEHTFFKVIEHDDARTATQSPEGFLVELGPDAGTGAKDQETDRLAAVAEGHDEQPRTPIFSGLRIADHRTFASVIHLRFFSGRRDDHDSWLRGSGSAQLADKAFDTLVAATEASFGHQILPDGHSITAPTQT